MEEEDRIITGSFKTSISAILFVKYLLKEGVEGYFDIDMIEPLSMAENVDRYKKGKLAATHIATTLHRDVKKRGQIYLFEEERVIDLFNDNTEIKEEDI
jgi:hypothetical protein